MSIGQLSAEVNYLAPLSSPRAGASLSVLADTGPGRRVMDGPASPGEALSAVNAAPGEADLPLSIRQLLWIIDHCLASSLDEVLCLGFVSRPGCVAGQLC